MRVFDKSVLRSQLYIVHLGMFVKSSKAYISQLVVLITILEHLSVENIWNLSISIKVLIQSSSFSLDLKISFIQKISFFHIFFRLFSFILYSGELNTRRGEGGGFLIIGGRGGRKSLKWLISRGVLLNGGSEKIINTNKWEWDSQLELAISKNRFVKRIVKRSTKLISFCTEKFSTIVRHTCCYLYSTVI